MDRYGEIARMDPAERTAAIKTLSHVERTEFFSSRTGDEVISMVLAMNVEDRAACMHAVPTALHDRIEIELVDVPSYVRIVGRKGLDHRHPPIAITDGESKRLAKLGLWTRVSDRGRPVLMVPTFEGEGPWIYRFDAWEELCRKAPSYLELEPAGKITVDRLSPIECRGIVLHDWRSTPRHAREPSAPRG